MLDRLAASDYEGTLFAARALLQNHPGHADAQQCRVMAEKALCRLYEARMGIEEGTDRVPRRRNEDFRCADVRTRLVLRQVDGKASVGDIVAQSHLESVDTLRLLSELLLQDAIDFEG